MKWVKHYGSIALVVIVVMYAAKRVPFLSNLVG